METLKLASEYREEAGKGAARRIRAQGRIPAVLYGAHEDTVPITVDEKEFRQVLSRGETTILDLTVSGKVEKECSVIVKDLQHHPATGRVLHVDLQAIRRGESLRLSIPVRLIGTPRGVKEMGGILEHGSRELNIRCLPRDIPDTFEIDVSELAIHDAIHLGAIVGGYSDIEFLDDLELTLANVLPPKLEVETVTEEEEGEEEPEVIAKGKEDKTEAGEEKGTDS